MRDLVQELIAAARRLRTRPGLTVAAVLTLALNIGATTAIFTVVSGVLLRPLPFPNEDRLVTVCEEYPGSSADWCAMSPPNAEDIAARSRAIEAIGLGREWGYHLATPNGAETVSGGLATPGMFRALGVTPVVGRLIDDRDLLGRPSAVALISYEMWRDRFGGDSAIIGHVLSLDKDAVTIVGVLPRGFQAPRLPQIDIWRPLHISPRDEEYRTWRGFIAYARLRPGVPLDVARKDLAGIADQLRIEHFSATPWNLSLTSLRDLVVGSVRPVLLLFLGAVGLVLLIGCANVTNLLLVRATSRRREMALRAALGASRWRIARGLLAESLLLAVVGGGLGIALAFGGVRIFKSLAPQGIPRVSEIAVDFRVLAFTAVVSVFTALAFGLLPALRGARVDLGAALREGGRSGTGHRNRIGNLLVVAELALAIVVVAAAGLLGRSFLALAAWNPGFDRSHAMLFTLSPPESRYDSSYKIAALWNRVEGELRTIPGVTRVGSASGGPLFGGDGSGEMEVSGYAPDDRKPVAWYDVSPDFFAALGVPVVRGRPLDARDVRGGPLVALVNEALVRRFWPNVDPIGQRIGHRMGTSVDRFTVVGVVRDVPPFVPGAPIEPQMYWSNRQIPRPYSYFLVRTSVSQAAVAAAIRSRVRAIDRDLEVKTIRTMDDVVDRHLEASRFDFVLISSFAAAALVLAAIGTYALLSYFVAERTREIGIRMALGANAGRVRREIASRGLALAASGVAIGLAATLALGRTVASIVAGVSSHDPMTLIAAAAALLLVATLACVWPAWRASRVDPALVLTAE
ncbi:MAG: ABC transporter permease [Gemmatimonadaceae bacterium]